MPFLKRNLELLFWVAGLLLLYFMPVTEEHFTICPLNNLGFTWCPGCGIGHSIHYYLHLDLVNGWREHFMGVFALPIIFYRIFQLLQQNFLNKNRING